MKQQTSKKTSSRTQAKVPPQVFPPESLSDAPKHDSRKSIFIIGILVLILLGLAVANKGLIVAAVVEGKPIFTWQLHKTLRSRFGQQTLEGMIGEMLVEKQARLAGVSVTTEEVAQKEQEIVEGLGSGVSLEDLLKYQGMTREDFDSQIRLQLMVNKLLGSDVAVTQEEIDEYLTQNQKSLMATEPAAMQDEAREAILNQKINEKLQPWFSELRENAKVLLFL